MLVYDALLSKIEIRPNESVADADVESSSDNFYIKNMHSGSRKLFRVT